jgi:hypothetical protein
MVSDARESLIELLARAHFARGVGVGGAAWEELPLWTETYVTHASMDADLLLDAGWRPPIRHVASPQHLDDLPAGSIILDYYGFAWQKSRFEAGHPWRRADGSGGELHWGIDLPEYLLWTPDDVPTPDGRNSRHTETQDQPDE